MVAWVHCNKCFLRFTTQTSFYITNCTHVYCEVCLEKLKQKEICLLCNSHKPAFIKLSTDMPESVKTFFVTDDVLDAQVDKTICAMKFRLKNYLNLLEQTAVKYNKIKAEYVKLNNHLISYKNENKKLKELLKMRLEVNKRNEYKTSTPAALKESETSSVSSAYFNNITYSTISKPRSTKVVPGHERFPQQATRLQQPDYRSNPMKRMQQGNVGFSRPSPSVPPSTTSSRSSGLSSLRYLCLLDSSQRQHHVYGRNRQKF